MDWKTETYSLGYLESKATLFDYINGGVYDDRFGMLNFLKWAGVVPVDVDWKRRNAIPQTSMDANAIPAMYLAEVALEWDDDGVTDAFAFVDMLRAEVSGTPENAIVSETMQELGSL